MEDGILPFIEKFKSLFRDYTCTDCGTHVSEADKICPECGADLSETVQPSEANVEEREAELLVRKRHKAIRGLMQLGNFIGWILCFTVILLPIGLALLYFGHITLATIETEQNTREIVSLLRESINAKQQ